MTNNVNPCRGCVCQSCAKSEKQGNTYGCPYRRCKNCEGSEVIYKLNCCDDAVPIAEGGDLFTYE